MRDTSLFVQKVSVMMPWQYFARYNITTCRMRQRILFRPETCLEMGLANDALRILKWVLPTTLRVYGLRPSGKTKGSVYGLRPSGKTKGSTAC